MCASRDERGCIGVVLARDDREAARVLGQHARDLQRNPRRQQQLRFALDLQCISSQSKQRHESVRRGAAQPRRTAENGSMSMPRHVRIWKHVRSPVKPRKSGFCTAAGGTHRIRSIPAQLSANLWAL